MTAIATTPPTADADLVAASRNGDRNAFGQIVRKYQGLIAGLIYSSCGDLNASEDIAQETFLAAWKSLSGLREPSKLPAWLCQIARHRLLDQHRHNAQENARLARAVTQYDRATQAPPEQELMTAEEREVLWRSLAQIPEPYRETMVLYYRQNQSTAEVATALEISEDTVRQRLARGRAMLREQVSNMLERNLARSAPSAQFTSAVVAALPALMAQGATAAATGSAVKATAAKGLLSLPVLAIWIGPLIGLAGGIFGTANSIRATQTPRERKFVIRLSIIVWIYVLSAMAILFTLVQLMQRYHWSAKTNILAQSAFWLIYAIVLVTMVLRWNHRHRQLRIAEGLSPIPASVAVITPFGRFLSLAGPTIGSVAWIFAMAIPARDTLGIAITCAFTLTLIGWGWLATHGTLAPTMRSFYFRFITVLCAFNAIMLNWRLYTWMSGMTGISIDRIRHNLPLWVANVLLLTICILIYAITWVTTRNRNPNLRP